MPDDTCKTPVWSLDSKRSAFLTFEQDPALIKIYEAAPEEAEKYLRDFLNDSNENFRIIADVTLNVIDIVAET